MSEDELQRMLGTPKMAEPGFKMLSGFCKRHPDLLERVGELFDSEANGEGAGKDQVLLNGLAMLLVDLDAFPEDDEPDAAFHVPALRYMQALQAAYQLGKAAGLKSLGET